MLQKAILFLMLISANECSKTVILFSLMRSEGEKKMKNDKLMKKSDKAKKSRQK